MSNSKPTFLSIMFNLVIGFVLISAVVVNVALLIYVAFNDYIFYELDQVAIGFDATGYIVPEAFAAITVGWSVPPVYLQYIDFYWLISFLVLVISTFVMSYGTRRQGYYGFFSFLTYGMMFLLFVLSIFITTSEWIQTILRAAYPSLSVSMPFYSFYLDNAGVITLIIALIAGLLNFVDFDFARFNPRKAKENVINDEIN